MDKKEKGGLIAFILALIAILIGTDPTKRG